MTPSTGCSSLICGEEPCQRREVVVGRQRALAPGGLKLSRLMLFEAGAPTEL